jgi:7,8-dihydropterin-6-yl-methyl-4-(beta-D-ribofuranosyl)aminobenzene 5'-phosphate synthase
MKKVLILVVIGGAVLVVAILYNYTEMGTEIENTDVGATTVKSPLDSGLSITVIYDNYPYKKGLKTHWGFSCLIKGTEKTILFDTGRNGNILLENMKKLDINLEEIDVVVISHDHGDHTGGLRHVLEQNKNVTVYLPGVSTTFKEIVKEKKATVVEVTDSMNICENVYTTGALGGGVVEQSLIITTEKGTIVITGCAHPGIVHIVEKAKELISDDILLVMGGFHLENRHTRYLESIISQLKEMGVVYAGPCHCSGDTTRELFEREYGEHYIEIGVGKVITLDELQ